MIRLLCTIFLICYWGISINAQHTDRHVKSFQKQGHSYLLQVNDGAYRIKFYSDYIVECHFIPSGESVDTSSHAVIASPLPLSIQVKESDSSIFLGSAYIKINISKKPFKLTYSTQDEVIVSESSLSITDSLRSLAFHITPDEALYGGGARALGMNRRGNLLKLYNQAHYGYGHTSQLLNYTMPIVLSSRKYMLHFDNAPTGYLDLDSDDSNMVGYGAISGNMRYQVIAAASWPEVLEQYTWLTGRQPLPPRWALGNFASRFGYHSQREVLQTINLYRKDSIPVDAVILDLFWFGKKVKGAMGNLKFDTDSFPDPDAMIQQLRNSDVETVLITEPYIQTTSDRWHEAVQHQALAIDSLGQPYTFDFFFGNTGLMDVFSPQGYHWFGQKYQDLLDMGISGFWGDLGEPETHPADMIHATGTANEVHNIYGHEWARLIAETYSTHPSALRPFILMRAGYSGSQRYGLIPWSGDVSRSWEGLQSQPEIALQMGMQGISYMHSDLGGFAGANLDDELYIRWLQYGVFQPVYRPHAQEDVPSEPVFRSDYAKNMTRKAINLRYSLLPYNYNLVYQAHISGMPMMRPLIFEEPENVSLQYYTAAYLWGNNLLISPVLNPAQEYQEVYFPKESIWMDFYSEKVYEGGAIGNIKIEPGHIPTFVRAGSFIPMAKGLRSTKDYHGDTLELHYYAHSTIKNSEYTLYNDDGHTPNAVDQGNYEIMRFTAHAKPNRLELTFTDSLGEYYPVKTKHIVVLIHNIGFKPKKVTIDGNKASYQYTKGANTLSFEFDWQAADDLSVIIK